MIVEIHIIIIEMSLEIIICGMKIEKDRVMIEILIIPSNINKIMEATKIKIMKMSLRLSRRPLIWVDQIKNKIKITQIIGNRKQCQLECNSHKKL